MYILYTVNRKMKSIKLILNFVAVVIRLWRTINDQTKVLFVWGIELSGLLYIAPMPVEPHKFHSNSLVFCMTGGYFTAPHCIIEDQPTLARITDHTVSSKDVRRSGSVLQLTRYCLLCFTIFNCDLFHIVFLLKDAQYSTHDL